MTNSSSPKTDNERNASSNPDDTSDFATAEVPSATAEFGASIDHGIKGTEVAEATAVKYTPPVFAGGRRRRASIIL